MHGYYASIPRMVIMHLYQTASELQEQLSEARTASDIYSFDTHSKFLSVL